MSEYNADRFSIRSLTVRAELRAMNGVPAMFKWMMSEPRRDNRQRRRKTDVRNILTAFQAPVTILDPPMALRYLKRVANDGQTLGPRRKTIPPPWFKNEH